MSNRRNLFRSLADISLRSRLMLLMALPLAALAVFLLAFFPAHMSSTARGWAEKRATAITLLLADALAPYLDFEDDQGARGLLEKTVPATNIHYAAIRLEKDGSLYAAVNPSAIPDQKTTLTATTATTTTTPATPVSFSSNGCLHVTARIAPRDRQEMSATLLLGFSLADLEAERTRSFKLVALISALLFAAGLVFSAIVGTRLVQPIRQLTQVTANIVSQGDLTQEIRIHGNDEVGLLAESFREMVKKLRDLPLRIGDLAGKVVSVARQVTDTAATVKAGAIVVQERVGETSASMGGMQAALTGVTRNVDVLHRNAQSTARSNQHLVAASATVGDHVKRMTEVADVVAQAVSNMLESVKDISRTIEGLDSSVEITSSAMVQMTKSIERVEKSAIDTLTLSERVSRDAESGEKAIAATLAGIDEIRATSQAMAVVIKNLGERIESVNSILKVIVGVADETKLLALNASILAAQAGEHGAGFRVVADQIKGLAQRTNASAKDIAELIHNVNQESAKALTVIGDGSWKAEEGARLGLEAASALKQISESANRTAAMVKGIAKATFEQAQNTKQVTASIQRICYSVQGINTASQNQARGSARIMAVTHEMRETTAHVRQSVGKQDEASHLIADAVASIYDMLEQVNRSQKEQNERATQAQRSVHSIKEVASNQLASTIELDRAIKDLETQAESLHAAIRQFRA
ncbi:MAG: methyl-accepting chemotaxis protein [Pseudomonadota bacterium]